MYLLRTLTLFVSIKLLVGLPVILEAGNPIRRGYERRCIHAPPAQVLTPRKGIVLNSDWKRGSEMTIINATPHALILLAEDATGAIAGVVGFGRGRAAQFRQVAELVSSGIVPRAATTKVAEMPVEIDGMTIPVDRTAYGEVEGLPAPDGEAIYVVSLLTAQAAAAGGRTTEDLLVIGETVRDEGGRIIGCTGFGRI